MAITLQKRYVSVKVYAKGTTNPKEFLNQNSIGPRIDFNVVKYPQDGNNGLNVAYISLYNLSEDTFRFIVDQGKQAVLTAGWQSNYAELFNGSIMSVIRTREGTDIITKLYCNENGLTDNINKAFRKSFNTIRLNDLLDSFKSYGFVINRPNFPDVIQNRAYSGSLLDILRHLAVRYNFTFEIEGGALKITKNTDKNRIMFEFSPESGILKPPIITEKGADVEVFLNPTIRPNDFFKLNSKFSTFNIGAMEFVERVRESFLNTQATKFVSGVKADTYKGTYKVLQMQHDGSTHSNTWLTRLEGMRWTI